MPGVSFASSHGWLNHVARISPVSSATCAVRMWSRPRRRRGRAAHDDLDHRLLLAEELAIVRSSAGRS